MKKQRSNKILYLICRENILAPGVMKSQVLDLLGEIADNPETEITILNFPSIHNFLKYRNRYVEVSKFCLSNGVNLKIAPILPIGRSFMPVWAIPFFLIQVIPVIFWFLVLNNFNIIHARTYLSALAVYFLRRIGIKTGFVFDMRSPFLMESLAFKYWSKTDYDYKFWEIIERKLFSSADMVVSQASGMAEYVKNVYANAKVAYIPNYVNEKLFDIKNEERFIGRSKFGINKRFVILYLGSFGPLHNSREVAELYVSLREFVSKPYFLVVTHTDPKSLTKDFEDLSVPNSEYKLLVNPPNINQITPLADAGLNQVSGPSAAFVTAVKFPEYLASGLPSIVDHRMASITNIVEKENCGVVIDLLDKTDTKVKMHKLVKEQKTMKRNALNLARRNFSVRVCAKQYLKIYDEITQKVNS